MTKPTALTLAVLMTTIMASPHAPAQEWKPAKGPLMTKWANDVKADSVLPEYPRPQLVRKEWQNLNGLWEYAIRPKAEAKPANWDGKILVPFAAESALSGVMKPVGTDNRLWYRRTFKAPDAWKGQRVLLHFGAVDWETTVWLNGKLLGTHRGGYDPFSFDLSQFMTESGEQELVVGVWDPTDAGEQPRGKQLTKAHGIWYTPVTGIWQTVWIEPVQQAYVRSLKIVPDIDQQQVTVTVDAVGTGNATVTVLDGEKELGKAEAAGGRAVSIKVPDQKLWTPETPHLYSLRVSFGKDAVDSYFGMRKSSLAKDDKGVVRMMLNNKFVFQWGPLDQGWWPDGLYTAPTDAALKYDVEITKKLGFNMARKHTKVEPARWYYWCDKLGLLVWQDMVTGFSSARPFAKWDPIGTHDGTEGTRDEASRMIFDTEHKAMIDAFHNHPSIVVWVPFNEGWGQFDTVRVVNWLKQYDPTRLVNTASGGNDFPVGDIKDLHMYPGPGAPKPDGKRALVLGEFGGLGLPVEGHTWPSDRKWGYRDFQQVDALTESYTNLMVRLRRLIDEPGLSAAVYTQTTDVEGEVNGLLTYDRAVIKIPEDKLLAAHKKLSEPPAKITTVVPDARTEKIEWRYTTEKPADGWEKPGFDDSAWKTGPAGFGTEGTPGAIVRTKWDTPEIWIRRTFELPEGAALKSPHVVIHHDDDAEVYLNGESATRVRRHTSEYIEQLMTPAAKAALKPGKNIIAAHCKQTGGGQYIDVGLMDIEPGETKKPE